MIQPNTIVPGDCIEVLRDAGGVQADLVFADPPFNIGYKYDLYQDRKAYDDYYAWTEKWMAACRDVLKPAGSFWVAIGDDYAAEVRIIGRKLGLHLRNWVIWHYTFGQNTQRKFARSHTHLFYWVKDPKHFTFNPNAVRVPSDRQREYKDKRALNTWGKVPDDVWTEFPRVCGTFRERESWHPCQMPETILARIVRTCSNANDLVLDPFAGSGTTLVVAKKLGRNFIGIELSSDYVEKIEARLEEIICLSDIEGERKGPWHEEHLAELASLYAETGTPTDRLHSNPTLLACFAQQFNWRLEVTGATVGYSVREVWRELELLRKRGKLPRVKVHARELPGPEVRQAPKEIPPRRLFGDSSQPRS